MRATAADVMRHPTWLGSWVYDLPGRRRSWWRGLLFERGQGWLRWRMDGRSIAGGYYEPPEPYTVAPPLRRLAMAIHCRQKWPLTYLRDEDRKRGGAL